LDGWPNTDFGAAVLVAPVPNTDDVEAELPNADGWPKVEAEAGATVPNTEPPPVGSEVLAIPL
jgi:hypothetical protein